MTAAERKVRELIPQAELQMFGAGWAIRDNEYSGVYFAAGKTPEEAWANAATVNAWWRLVPPLRSHKEIP